jgi:hypothetical protein
VSAGGFLGAVTADRVAVVVGSFFCAETVNVESSITRQVIVILANISFSSSS